MICRQCNAVLPDESHFCPYCMTKFDEESNDSKDVNNSWILIVIVLIAAVLAVAVIVVSKYESNNLNLDSTETNRSQEQSDVQTLSETETATAEINGRYYEPGTYFWNIDGNGEIVLEDFEYYPF